MVSTFLVLLLSQYSYSPVGKTDPFRPIAPPVEPIKNPTPLEKWDLAQLKLIAVVMGPSQPYAMVEDPKGKGHTIRRGDRIGKNRGRVVGISTRKVTIKEEAYDYTGRKIVSTQKMEIIEEKLTDD